MCEHNPVEYRDAETGQLLYRSKAQPPACPDASGPATLPKRKRHKWLKLRVHAYVCRVCGMGKINANTSPEDERGDWFTTYHTPNGRSIQTQHTPECVIGPLTDKYLAKYADALAVPF